MSARPQLGELVGRVAARQHVEHAFEDARGSARRTAPRGGPRRRASSTSHVVHRHHRDDLLRERRRAGCADSGSTRPRRRASRASTAAHATRSPRNFGKMTPRLAAPIVWPARPMRCRPLATDGGASIWTTRSIAPMSMPSSSDEVATSAAELAGLEPIFDLDRAAAARASRDASGPASRRPAR